MKLNRQKPEDKTFSPLFLDVHSVFCTIQGEGPFAGTPAVFVRLAGCNLQCPMCDTQYTNGRKMMRPTEVVHLVENYQERGLVVITGGEPFRQDIAELMSLLVRVGFYVQVESNGSLSPTKNWPWSTRTDERAGTYLVVSPKKRVHKDAFIDACALKYVVSAYCIGEDGLPNGVLGYRLPPERPPEGWSRPIYIQPADEQNFESNNLNRAAAVESAMKHGYILQLQIHKLIGME